MKTQPIRSGQIIIAFTLSIIILTISIVCFSPSFAHDGKKDRRQKSEPTVPDVNRSSTTIVIDSNGKRRSYSSINALSPKQKEQLRRELKALNDTLQRLADIGPEIQKSLGDLGETIGREAGASVAAAMASVDWDKIGQQMDEAMEQVAAVDWHKVDREIANGLAVADKTLSDPKLRDEIRREMAEVRREAAMARKEYADDHRRAMADTRQSMNEAKRELERSRRKMEEAREEMKAAQRQVERLQRESD